MKKIMLIAAVMFAAIAANAASVKWSAGNIYDHTGSRYAGAVDLFAVANGGDFSDAFKVDTGTVSSGTLTAITSASDSLVAGNWYDFYLFIEDGEYTFTSTAKSKIAMQPTGTATVAFGNMTTQTQTVGGWVRSAVPEPTSGLLLLLGMAGLALKRKVA